MHFHPWLQSTRGLLLIWESPYFALLQVVFAVDDVDPVFVRYVESVVEVDHAVAGGVLQEVRQQDCGVVLLQVRDVVTVGVVVIP